MIGTWSHAFYKPPEVLQSAPSPLQTAKIIFNIGGVNFNLAMIFFSIGRMSFNLAMIIFSIGGVSFNLAMIFFSLRGENFLSFRGKIPAVG